MTTVNRVRLDFRIFKGHCHTNQLSFSAILFLCHNSKMTRDGHLVPGKGNKYKCTKFLSRNAMLARYILCDGPVLVHLSG